jgi:phosphoribosylpyrophosphate synthetase
MENINIKVSITNPIILDLFFQALHQCPVESTTVNYLYGARCDKGETDDYYVTDVASKMVHEINANNAFPVKYLAPHCMKYFTYGSHIAMYDLPDCVDLAQYDLVVFPDESAYSRYSFQLGAVPFLVCQKHRDQDTGAIISHEIPKFPNSTKRILVLDDLCDAGGSFVKLGSKIPTNVKADLFVFHGVFTQATPLRLFKYYENIIVSNSIPLVDKMSETINRWKDNKIDYKQACEDLGLKTFLEYKDAKLGNLVVFDVWN